MPVLVVPLHPLQPGLDLADPEAELAAHPEAARTAALAAQVVDRLRGHVQVRAQFGEGNDLLDESEGRLIGRFFDGVVVSMPSRCTNLSAPGRDPPRQPDEPRSLNAFVANKWRAATLSSWVRTTAWPLTSGSGWS
jgi:hypothetical protein